MLAKKKKLSKKEIKEDKLVTSYYKAFEFFEKYKQQHIIAIVVIIIVVVGSILYSTKQQEAKIAATTELSRVMPLFEQGQFQKAIDGEDGTNIIGLVKIVEEFGGSEQGEIAKIYLGNSYYNLGEIDKALEAYGNYSGSNSLFKASSLAGKGACYESNKDYSKAASSYEKAAKVSKANASNGQFLVLAGINYANAGDKDSAKEIFELVKADYSSTINANDLERYFAMLEI